LPLHLAVSAISGDSTVAFSGSVAGALTGAPSLDTHKIVPKLVKCVHRNCSTVDQRDSYFWGAQERRKSGVDNRVRRNSQAGLAGVQTGEENDGERRSLPSAGPSKPWMHLLRDEWRQSPNPGGRAGRNEWLLWRPRGCPSLKDAKVLPASVPTRCSSAWLRQLRRWRGEAKFLSGSRESTMRGIEPSEPVRRPSFGAAVKV